MCHLDTCPVPATPIFTMYIEYNFLFPRTCSILLDDYDTLNTNVEEETINKKMSPFPHWSNGVNQKTRTVSYIHVSYSLFVSMADFSLQ